LPWCEVKGRLRAAVKHVRATVRRYSRAVWSRDRAALGGWASLWTRIARISTWSIRGVVANRLSLQAAALAYYTMFSIVPVLVVVLWALKLFHVITYLTPDAATVPAVADGSAEARFPNANELLRQAARGILMAVQRAGKLETGIVGLAALLYGLIRQVIHVEVALDTIAGARDRPAKYRRMLGYLAVLVLPPALIVVSGLLRTMSHLPVGETIAGWLDWLFAAAPWLKSALGIGVGLTVLCVSLAIFYASAARARIKFESAMVGAALSAVALAVVLWVFARLQIGASRVGALESGMAAIPVFLLWSFSSWLVILIGAQVAVAHELDGILIHGASALKLDPYGEQVAGVQIMVEATRHALSPVDGAGGADGIATANALARQLRLLPRDVRGVADRLQKAGLIREAESGEYLLACDPDRTKLRDVVGAVIGHPADERVPVRTGPSLHELAARQAAASTK
jgi:membrane protein